MVFLVFLLLFHDFINVSVRYVSNDSLCRSVYITIIYIVEQKSHIFQSICVTSKYFLLVTFIFLNPCWITNYCETMCGISDMILFKTV